MAIELTFHGAAGTVTGSCMELALDGKRLLIDCGMFQGSRSLEALNHEPLPFDPLALDAVILTHAHLDHCGRLPVLTRRGSSAPIWCTPPTARLIDPLLLDAAKLQEADVQRRNRRPDRAGLPPFDRLYDANDVRRTVKLARGLDYGTWTEPVPGIRMQFHDAHHILGSASVELIADGQRLLFSGDLGMRAALEIDHDKPDKGFDHIVCESTYGDRDRIILSTEARRSALGAVVRSALARGGNLLIPAFALERTQIVLADLVALFESGALAPSPVYVDSPLAERTTRAYRSFGGVEIDGSPSPFDAANVHFTQGTAQSRALNGMSGAIIIAGSGMCNGGRIRHHLIRNIARPDSTVLFVGYQARGTLGAVLRAGAKTVRISGGDFPVLAHIEALDTYSAHADRAALLRWITACGPVSGSIFLDHGEKAALEALSGDIAGLEGMPQPLIPALGERFSLEPAAPARRTGGARPRAALLVAGEDWRNTYAAFISSLERHLAALPTDDARERALREADQAVARAGPEPCTADG